MSDTINLDFTVFNSITDTTVYKDNKKQSTWLDLIPLFMKPRVVPSKSDVKLISGCSFNGASRSNVHIDKRSFITLDYDDGTHYNYFISKYLKYEFVLYTSFSHSAEQCRFRVIIPLAEQIDGQEFSKAKTELRSMFPEADPASFVASQAFYVPSCSVDNIDHFYSYHNKGELFDFNQELGDDFRIRQIKAILGKQEKQTQTTNSSNTLSSAERILSRIDPDLPYDAWWKIAAALKAEFGDDAYTLWNEWSSGGSSYNPRIMEHKWNSLSNDSPYNMGFVVNKSKQFPIEQ